MGSWNKEIRAGLVAGLSMLVLITMVEVGVRLPQAGGLAALSDPRGLDYGAPPFNRIKPLRSSFIDSVFGGSRVPVAFSPTNTLPARPGFSDLGPEIVSTDALDNNDVADAYPASRVPFTARASTVGADREANEPADCASLGGTIWYRFTPRRSIGLVASAVAGRPVALAVYASKGATALACDTDAQGRTKLTLNAVGGATYLFQVTSQVPGQDVVFSLDRQVSTSLVSARKKASTTGDSFYPAISGNGRYVVFNSPATDLDPRCPCGPGWQVYLRDVATGVTEFVSWTDDEKFPNASSDFPVVSADGRFVAWHTDASNIVPGDRNGLVDVYVRDRLLAKTERVTVTTDGREMSGMFAKMSADGQTIAFFGDDEDRYGPNHQGSPISDTYVRSRVKRTTTLVSVPPNATVRGNHDSRTESISPDGRFVMFWSRATNLIPGATTPADEAANAGDLYMGRLFIKDTLTGKLTAECMSQGGEPANDRCWAGAVTNGGRYSLFWSQATNLVDELPDQPTGTNYVLYLYLRDRTTGRFEIVNVTDNGTVVGELWDRRQVPGISGDKRTVTVSISADGRFVAFDTDAILTPADGARTIDTFVRDRLRGRTYLISESQNHFAGNGESNWPSISLDGSLVAFQSRASDLVDGDLHQGRDVFIRAVG